MTRVQIAAVAAVAVALCTVFVVGPTVLALEEQPVSPPGAVQEEPAWTELPRRDLVVALRSPALTTEQFVAKAISALDDRVSLAVARSEKRLRGAPVMWDPMVDYSFVVTLLATPRQGSSAPKETLEAMLSARASQHRGRKNPEHVERIVDVAIGLTGGIAKVRDAIAAAIRSGAYERALLANALRALAMSCNLSDLPLLVRASRDEYAVTPMEPAPGERQVITRYPVRDAAGACLKALGVRCREAVADGVATIEMDEQALMVVVSEGVHDESAADMAVRCIDDLLADNLVPGLANRAKQWASDGRLAESVRRKLAEVLRRHAAKDVNESDGVGSSTPK